METGPELCDPSRPGRPAVPADAGAPMCASRCWLETDSVRSNTWRIATTRALAMHWPFLGASDGARRDPPRDLGVAGVVEGDRCALTNNPWVVDAAELRARFGFADIRVVNDFEAIAWSLPHLTRDDIGKIGGRERVAQAPMVVLGPGTGLGVAAYVPGERGASVLRSEGGHATMPSSSLREDAIIENLRQRVGHVSAERVLSGPAWKIFIAP